MEVCRGFAPRSPAYETGTSLTTLADRKQNWCERRELHPQGSLLLRQASLLFPVNHIRKMVLLVGLSPTSQLSRGRILYDWTTGANWCGRRELHAHATEGDTFSECCVC
jgi:hypothetical protein